MAMSQKTVLQQNQLKLLLVPFFLGVIGCVPQPTVEEVAEAVRQEVLAVRELHR